MSARTGLWSRLLGDSSGSGLLELALTASIVLMCLIGVLDGARAVYIGHYVGNAARDATRYAMVRGSTWNGTSCASVTAYSCNATASDVTRYVQNQTPSGMSVTGLNVATVWTGLTPSGQTCDTSLGKNSPTCVVQVTVSYNFSFMVPFITRHALVLKSTAAVAIAR